MVAVLLAGPRPARADAPPADTRIDLNTLFGTGALSPTYPRLHAGSTASKLSPASVSDGDGPTWVSVQVNPALFAFGIWSFRAEVAIIPYLSVLGEYSRVHNFSVPKLEDDVHLDGNLYDVGLHLWPQGHGVRGFYLGARYSFGSGTDGVYEEGKLRAWGVDLGYQWVAGVFAFNLGVGGGPGKATITPSDAVRNDPSTPPELRDKSVEVTFPRPYVTVGLGAAF